MAVPFLSAIGLGLRQVGQVLTGAASRAATSTVKAAKRALSGIRGGVARGVAPRVIERTLERAGIPVPQPTLEKVITQERRRREAGAKLKNLGRNRRPNPTRLPLSLTPIARAYAFLVEVQATAVSTGERVTRWITVSTDELLTRGEIEDRAQSMIEGEADAYGLTDITVTVSEGMRASDLSGFEREV